MNPFGQYELLNEAGSGGCGQVFVVIKQNDVEKKAYILKTVNLNSEKLLKDKQTLKNEMRILSKLNQNQDLCPYIPKLYFPDKNKCEENIIQEDNIMEDRPYLVIDYFSKQNLFYYLVDNSFSELHAKVIFKKIVEGIKYCHDKNICHLDIKPANIIFDKTFEPIILDFGYSTEFRNANNEIIKLTEGKGTEEYVCPEMREGKEYSEKADVFSLGIVLFNLVTGKNGFGSSRVKDRYYRKIIEDTTGTYENYWKKISPAIDKELSENFKSLYIKMVAYDPIKRPTTQQILDSAWLKEIKDLKDEDKKKLDETVKKELETIYEDKIKPSLDEDLILSENIIPKGYTTRSGDGDVTIFSNNLKPKKIPNDRISINHHIILKGYLKEIAFMSLLLDKIKNCKKLGEDVTIIASEEKLKLRVTFEEEEEGEEEGEEKEEDKYYKECVIDIELFQYEDGRYLLEFLRRKGEIPEYYKNFMIIKDIIKNEMNI